MESFNEIFILTDLQIYVKDFSMVMYRYNYEKYVEVDNIYDSFF